ncbi:mll5336 [Mesorhizobium japonicum MAFF 303099]|uniref:Mll5336 protein n=1 Tax=Mesorhizobium japonicum (strain LMG 29417 / CECT 9101 / MAFF 303099) TaxID=266835 RepID=Q98C16_RHILO|nr:mll5336 [Mesorhizobium japonicum MAFF 303099]
MPPAIKVRAAMKVTGWDGLDADLDEGVGGSPQHRQHAEQGQVGCRIVLCRHGDWLALMGDRQSQLVSDRQTKCFGHGRIVVAPGVSRARVRCNSDRAGIT